MVKQIVPSRAARRHEILLSYLAGILDGEGCITAAKRGKVGGHYINVAVVMTDRRVIDLLAATFGGTVSKRYYPTPTGKTGCKYGWRVHTGNAPRVLSHLLPYLYLKTEQAILGIRLCKRLSNTTRGTRVSRSEKKEREKLVRGIQALNQKFRARRVRRRHQSRTLYRHDLRLA